MTPQAVLAIHGGAGEIVRGAFSSEAEREFRDALDAILEQGSRALARGATALDVVTQAVVMLEDCPLFNAGRGAAYTSAGTHELDAAIMDGSTRAAGAVACVQGVRNPVLGARMVMEDSPHVLMVGEGATAFLRERGAIFEPESYFHSERRLAQLREARKKGVFGMLAEQEAGRIVPPLSPPLDERTKMGTVGAVALDRNGRLASAASTGGLTNKLPGRVGDTPVIGSAWAWQAEWPHGYGMRALPLKRRQQRLLPRWGGLAGRAGLSRWIVRAGSSCLSIPEACTEAGPAPKAHGMWLYTVTKTWLEGPDAAHSGATPGKRLQSCPLAVSMDAGMVFA